MRRDGQLLEDHLAKWRGIPLDYVNFDCVRFVGTWADVNLPSWSGKKDCIRQLVHRDATRLSNAVDEFLHPHDEPSAARWGDIVALDTPPLDTLGICEGSRCIFLDGEGGYIRRPLRSCFRAWRVE